MSERCPIDHPVDDGKTMSFYENAPLLPYRSKYVNMRTFIEKIPINIDN